MIEAAVLERDATDQGPSRDEGAAKRRQILEGARDVILRHGFDAASMNEIAKVAGVSKGTLYVYFQSKEDLFEAFVREEKRAQAEQMCRFDHDETDVRKALTDFGIRFLTRILQADCIAQLRTVAAASGRFPQVGRAYYEAGPAFGMGRLADYLREQHDRGLLSIQHFERAAIQLSDLCKSYYLTRAIFAAGSLPSEEEIRSHVESAIDMFLTRYGTDGAKQPSK